MLGEAAAASQIEPMYQLGRLLDERGDPGRAEHWYRRARTVDANRDLGLLLVKQDRSEDAEQWLEKAAEAGDVEAMVQLGRVLERRNQAFQAEQWYRWAAEEGDVAGQRLLGTLLLRRGDLAEAEQWLERAAAAGDAPAMSNLGLMLVQRGDLPAAQRWLQQSVDAGDVGGMVNLGFLFSQREDDTEAERWYLRAVEAGTDPSGPQREPAGPKNARDPWYRLPTPPRVAAMCNLGVLYSDRDDRAEAKRWYGRAASAGHGEAKRISEKLSPATYWG